MGNKKILIADDEPNVCSLVSSMLGKDYTVLKASNGEEAINVARSQKPHLILMDIMMPKVDGYTACSTIKTDQSTKMIPIIMITGVGHELNKKLANEIGADGYVTKPFTLQDLLDTIGQFVRYPK
ncbi:MAG: response regulator [Chloroflexi bacterium]|nr:response regulator [Chloroflexota bacterium]